MRNFRPSMLSAFLLAFLFSEGAIASNANSSENWNIKNDVVAAPIESAPPVVMSTPASQKPVVHKKLPKHHNKLVVSNKKDGLPCCDTLAAVPVVAAARVAPVSTTVNRLPQGNFEFAGADGIVLDANAMIPIYNRSDAMYYADVEGAYGTRYSDYSGEIGAGMRQAMQNNMLLGGYVFGGWTNPQSRNKFWVVNPGVEALGLRWDARVNGYFPVGNTQWATGSNFAQDVGNYNYETFGGHTVQDRVLTTYSEIGNGFDAEVGHTIPKLDQVKAYIGGYYFNLHNDIGSVYSQGGRARLEYTVNPYAAITASDTYDRSLHNTFMIGFRLSVGGLTKQNYGVALKDRDVTSRIMDPIAHNMGSVKSGDVELPRNTTRVGDLQTYRTNVYFFENSSSPVTTNTLADGTYEHPYTSDQLATQLPTLNGNNIYLAAGSNHYTVGSVTGLQNIAIYGRTSDFIQPGSGTGRPVMTGSLAYNAGNNTLDSISLSDTVTTNPGGSIISAIGLTNGSILNLSNSSISLVDGITPSGTDYYFFAVDNNASILNIYSGNSIYATSVHGGIVGDAAFYYNAYVNVLGNNNIFTATDTASAPYSTDDVVFSNNINEATLYHDYLNISGSNNELYSDGNDGGHSLAIYTRYGATINISGNNNYIHADIDSASQDNEMASAINMKVGVLNISGNNNTFSASMSNSASTYGSGTLIACEGSTVAISGNNNAFNMYANASAALNAAVVIKGKTGETSSFIVSGTGNSFNATATGFTGTGVDVAGIKIIDNDSIATSNRNITTTIGSGTTISASGSTARGIEFTTDGTGGSTPYNASDVAALSVTGTTFDVTSSSGNAWGIAGGQHGSGISAADAVRLLVGNTFNITGSSGTSGSVLVGTDV